ncbi:hypothetical protein [Parapedobacter defluvii]|uniref:hypothetical protein n=1 Tax=Parapedobacter defluvii TaxID=2045106 RepID=UPI00166AE2EF|nr:hypothetical protein [Parapedobacter defluvii]
MVVFILGTLLKIGNLFFQPCAFHLEFPEILFISRCFKLLVYHTFFQSVYLFFDGSQLPGFDSHLLFHQVEVFTHLFFNIGNDEVKVFLRKVQMLDQCLILVMQHLA